MLSTPLMLLSLLTFLPPKCFVRGDWKRSTASQESWIIHRLWSKRFSSYITILEDFHQILPGCYRAAALISACSRHLSIPLGLSGFWAFLEKYRDTAFINSAWEFLCAWPVFFFVPIFSEFFLLFQVDNFPIDLLWCERGHQHLPIGTGKSRGGSMKSSPAGTLLRSSKRRSRFSIFFSSQHSGFLFSLALDGTEGTPLLSAPVHKSRCRCQTCLLPSQRESARSEKRWSEGMFAHCAQSHRASEAGTFFFLSAEISLERGHLK